MEPTADPRDCVMTFVRAPVPGRVKTRLMACLSQEETARLYRAMVADVMTALDQSGVPVRVYVTPAASIESVSAWIGPRYRYFPQQGNGLGERMAAAFSRAFADGYTRAVLVGTDIPELSATIIRDAFEALQTTPVVFTPTTDGGYCLVGFRRDEWLPAVFSDALPWGSPTVLADTLAVLRAQGIPHHLLPAASDIDTPADLRALARRCIEKNCPARHTASALRAMRPRLAKGEQSIIGVFRAP